MKNILKKYWFVIVIGVMLVGAIAYYAVDLAGSEEYDTVEGKTVNNQDVLYSFNGVDITADEFYDRLYENYGENAVAQLFIRKVTDLSVETTDEMKEEAALNVENVKAQFAQSYGTDADAMLLQAIMQYGYESIDELDEFFINEAKSLKIMNEFVTVNKKDVYEAYEAEKSPRIVSHVLIAMEDPENPTEEETAKLDEAKAALAEGKSFEEVAFTYSDDGSAQSYGLLGFMDTDTPYVEEFLEVAVNTESGETSEWFMSQFGYHIIYVNSTDLNDLITESGFSTSLAAYDDTMSGSVYSEAIWAAAEELEVTYSSPELEAELKEAFGIGGNE